MFLCNSTFILCESYTLMHLLFLTSWHIKKKKYKNPWSTAYIYIYLCAFQSWLLSIVMLWSRFHFSDFSMKNYYTTFSKWWSAQSKWNNCRNCGCQDHSLHRLSLWWCQPAELFDLSLSLYKLHTFLIIYFRHLLIHTENYYETIP